MYCRGWYTSRRHVEHVAGNRFGVATWGKSRESRRGPWIGFHGENIHVLDKYRNIPMSMPNYCTFFLCAHYHYKLWYDIICIYIYIHYYINIVCAHQTTNISCICTTIKHGTHPIDCKQFELSKFHVPRRGWSGHDARGTERSSAAAAAGWGQEKRCVFVVGAWVSMGL